MAEDTTTPISTERATGGGRGGRPGGNRDAGGFRIRLSDNEMQAARALQEAFGLRSTVAVLGFSLRTLAQLLEEGRLDELVAQQRAQGGPRGSGPRRDDRRRERSEAPAGRGPRIDPFARPSRPAPAPEPEEVEAGPVSEPAPEASGEVAAETAAETAEAPPVASGESADEPRDDAA
jgi:hypothetical protein